MKIIYSDNNLIKFKKSWPGVPIFIQNGLVEPIPSEWALDLTIQGFSKSTVISYSKSLLVLFKFIEELDMRWNQIHFGIVKFFINNLKKERISESTIRLRMIHIQEFYIWARDKKYIECLPFEMKDWNFKNIIKETKLNFSEKINKKIKHQSSKDFEKIKESNMRKTPINSTRDHIIAEIARYMGLKRGEIANLKKSQFIDLDQNKEILFIQIERSIATKSFFTIIPKLLLKKIIEYIKVERKSLVDRILKNDESYQDNDFLFLNERGKNKGKPIDPNYIADSWKRSAKIAGIESRFYDNKYTFDNNTDKIEIFFGYNIIDFNHDDLLIHNKLINDTYEKEIK